MRSLISFIPPVAPDGTLDAEPLRPSQRGVATSCATYCYCAIVIEVAGVFRGAASEKGNLESHFFLWHGVC
jgi:hypothetical protein